MVAKYGSWGLYSGMMLKLIQLLFLFSGFAELTSAQPPRPEWGVVSDYDFDVRESSLDEDATALILSDYGEVYLTDDLDAIFDVHVRMRILTSPGVDYGSVSISYESKSQMQRIA